MEIPRAALADDADLAARRAPEFGGIVGGQDLYFLHGIDIGDADYGAVGASSEGRRAVEGDDGVLGAGAIDLEGLSAADGEVEVAHGAAAAHTRKGLRHVQGIAAVQFLTLNLGAGDFTLHGAGVCLQNCRRGNYFHGFRGTADGEDGIQGQRGVGG